MLFGIAGFTFHVAVKYFFGSGYKPTTRYDRGNAWSYSGRHAGSYEARDSLLGALITFGCAGFVGFLIAAIFSGAWTDEAIYAHTVYGKLTPAMMEGSVVRVKPYDVATNQIDNSFNSTTDSAENVEHFRYDGKMTWFAIQEPESTGRRLSGDSSSGLITVGGQNSEPDVTNGAKDTKGNFPYTTTDWFAANFGWHVHKICYTCDITEVIGIPTDNGPILAAPYVTWQGGWFVRRPVFSGVFIEKSGGKFERLSVKQAESDPVLVNSGRHLPRHAGPAHRRRLPVPSRHRERAVLPHRAVQHRRHRDHERSAVLRGPEEARPVLGDDA